MATLTLKNVPENLVEQLKGEARQNRRSLNQEAVSRLELSVVLRKRSAAETVAALRRLHKKLGRGPILTDAFIDRAKREGRP
ncbi:MAG: Arc family DNA-binding protein [Acidobacteriota bacterium]